MIGKLEDNFSTGFANKISPLTLNAIKRYIVNGLPVEDFLEAVICNKLREAVIFADDNNVLLLREILDVFHWDAPTVCYGTKERYDHWVKTGGLNHDVTNCPVCQGR
jgi:hypothetical protein